jgi:hypothetical protein
MITVPNFFDAITCMIDEMLFIPGTLRRNPRRKRIANADRRHQAIPQRLNHDDVERHRDHRRRVRRPRRHQALRREPVQVCDLRHVAWKH